MERVLQKLTDLFFSGEKEREDPLPKAEEELILLKKRIEAAQSRFDFSDGEGEIDAAVYDLNALETRYDLLVRRIKNGEA